MDAALTLALANTAILRRVRQAADRALTTLDALAAELERDPSNFRKTLKLLVEAGLLVRGETPADPILALTPAGERALAVEDFADGRIPESSRIPELPSGVEIRTLDRPRLPHTAFIRNPDQPRQSFDDADTLDLARAIAAAGDVLENIVSFPPDDASGARMLADGERRWRAVTLLADGKVEGCALPPALDPALGGGLPWIERAMTPEEADFIGLMTNAAHVDLDALEDGEALLRLTTARQWSVREACFKLGRVGKPDGEPGAGSKGVKMAQERVKVAREATPEAKARYRTDPDFTWKDLLACVQVKAEARAEPQPFINVEPTVSFVLPQNTVGGRARIDLALLPSGRWASRRRYDDNESGASSPLSYRAGDDSTSFATRTEAFADAAGYLRKEASRSTLSRTTGAQRKRILAWLDSLGDGARDPAPAQPAALPTRLNDTWAGEAQRRRDGVGGASAPSKPKADAPSAPTGPKPYTPNGAAIIALAEITFIHAEARRVGLSWAPAREYWLHQTVADMVEARLMRVTHEKGDGPRIELLDAGAEALDAAIEDRALAPIAFMTAEALDQVRGVCGQAFWPGPGFVTPWLNLEAAAPAAPILEQHGAPLDLTADDLAPSLRGEDADEEPDQTGEQILGEALSQIAAERAPIDGAAFLAGLLTRVGLAPPFITGAAGSPEACVLFDATGQAVLTVDSNGDLTDAMADARAMVIAATLNAALSLTVDFTPADAASPDDTPDEAAS